MFDYEGSLPAYVKINNGKTADHKGACDIPLLKKSIIVGDRFYNDFSLLNVWETNWALFVVRQRVNFKYLIIEDNELPDNRHGHILIDKISCIKGMNSKQKYPKKLRMIAIYYPINKQRIELPIKYSGLQIR